MTAHPSCSASTGRHSVRGRCRRRATPSGGGWMEGCCSGNPYFRKVGKVLERCPPTFLETRILKRLERCPPTFSKGSLRQGEAGWKVVVVETRIFLQRCPPTFSKGSLRQGEAGWKVVVVETRIFSPKVPPYFSKGAPLLSPEKVKTRRMRGSVLLTRSSVVNFCFDPNDIRRLSLLSPEKVNFLLWC